MRRPEGGVLRGRCAKVPLGHGGVGATRRRTGVGPPAGPGYKEAPRRAEFPGGLGSLLGLPPAPLQDPALVVSHAASEACQCLPTPEPLRWPQGPGGCCAFWGLILALASWAGSAPSAPPLHRGQEPGRAIELSAQRSRLGGAPGGEWSQGYAAPFAPAGWARGSQVSSAQCTHTQRSSRAGLRAQPDKLGARRGRTAAVVARVEGSAVNAGSPGLSRRPRGRPVD